MSSSMILCTSTGRLDQIACPLSSLTVKQIRFESRERQKIESVISEKPKISPTMFVLVLAHLFWGYLF